MPWPVEAQARTDAWQRGGSAPWTTREDFRRRGRN